MSKLLLSNDETIFSNIHNGFVNAGFSKFSKTSVDNNYYLVAYKKLRVDNTNFYQEEGDFVAISGTLIYHNEIGESSLARILHDFDGNNMKELRREIFGSYAIIIKKGDLIYTFVDENHTYKFYYYHKNNTIILTNTYYHIEKQVKEQFNIDIMLDNICGCFFMENHTPFSNIFQLLGTQYILMDTKNKSFEIKEIELNRYSLKSTEFEDSILEMHERLQKISTAVTSVTKDITVFLTGGLDSRLVFSGFINAGAKPTIGYWYGKDASTNTRDQDHILSKNMADGNNLCYADFDVEIDLLKSIKLSGKKYTDKYGECVNIYSCNTKLFEIFESKLKTEFVEFGYFGEPCRSLVSIDVANQEYFTVDEFAYMEYISHFVGMVENLEVHKTRLINWFSSYAVSMGFDTKHLSKEECMYLNYIYRLKADTVMCNYVNLFFYTTPILSQKIFVDGVLSVPYSNKLNAKWMLSLIKTTYSPLINYPVFSHVRERRINSKTLEMHDPLKMRLVDFAIKLGAQKLRSGLLSKIYLKFVAKDKKALTQFRNEKDAIEQIKERIVSLNSYNILGYDIFSKKYTLHKSQKYLDLLFITMELDYIFNES